MAEARAAVHEPKVRFNEEGTSEIEQETKVAKSVFQDLKICAFRTRFVFVIITCYFKWLAIHC